YFKKIYWILLAAVFLLISFGLLELYSIALSQNNLDLLNFKKQLLFVSIGIILLLAAAFFDYYNFRSFNNYIYLTGIFLLASVLFLGISVRGTKGWFDIFGFNIQPVEFVKIILIIFLARYFAAVSVKYKQLKHLIISGLGTLIFILLVLKQPDFGSGLILFLIWLAMIIFAGFNKKIILLILFSFIFVSSLSWFFIFKDYQKERIITFIDPSAKSLDQGYNVSQAIIAVGSGGLNGRGVGFGSQSQLKFLPEAQNDFIFAVIAEELGFFGVFLVVVFFIIIFYRLLIATRETNNDFATYLLLGTVALIFIEMFINIGMNIGIIPVIGISLPFISYGGSGIISSLILIGIAESIIIRSKIKY
ncbi:MAG: FtsW/RodA/SpoVE family cell cycle protein, partial [Candidatus Falkowbacteria bacterium]|nr:FtsW/RodA/SpoVE family cell cycle protein [Candidatus Falkowbacteria bacterium]